MKSIILATAMLFSIVPAASADYIDDQITKAEKRVASAEANLIKWRDCAAQREVCMTELRAKADKSLASAQKRAEALK